MTQDAIVSNSKKSIVPFFAKSRASEIVLAAASSMQFAAVIDNGNMADIPGLLAATRERKGLTGEVLMVDQTTQDFKLDGVDTLYFARGDRIPLEIQQALLEGRLPNIVYVVAIVKGTITMVGGVPRMDSTEIQIGCPSKY